MFENPQSPLGTCAISAVSGIENPNCLYETGEKHCPNSFVVPCEILFSLRIPTPSRFSQVIVQCSSPCSNGVSAEAAITLTDVIKSIIYS